MKWLYSVDSKRTSRNLCGFLYSNARKLLSKKSSTVNAFTFVFREKAASAFSYSACISSVRFTVETKWLPRFFSFFFFLSASFSFSIFEFVCNSYNLIHDGIANKNERRKKEKRLLESISISFWSRTFQFPRDSNFT